MLSKELPQALGISVPSSGPQSSSAAVAPTVATRRPETPPTVRSAGPRGGIGGPAADAARRTAEFDARNLTDRQVDDLVNRLSGPLTRMLKFDARKLPEGQVDELIHRLFGPLTRLLRTEFRLDRERIGKLRDARR